MQKVCLNLFVLILFIYPLIGNTYICIHENKPAQRFENIFHRGAKYSFSHTHKKTAACNSAHSGIFNKESALHIKLLQQIVVD